jgi:hypothetical protein
MIYTRSSLTFGLGTFFAKSSARCRLLLNFCSDNWMSRFSAAAGSFGALEIACS